MRPLTQRSRNRSFRILMVRLGELSSAHGNLLMVGQFPRDEMGRVGATAIFFAILAVVSFVANKTGIWERVKPVGRILTALWVLSPIVVYILLAGVPAVEDQLLNPATLIVGEVLILGTFALLWWQRVIRFSWLNLIGWAMVWPIFYVAWRLIGQSELFPPINPALWGGFMLTLIIAFAVILLSFPLGMALALGRRSEIRGIPWWLIWPVAIIATIWGLTNSTPDILDQAEGTVQQLLAFWPLLILVAAYILAADVPGQCHRRDQYRFYRVRTRRTVDHLAVHGHHHGSLLPA